MGNTGPNSTCTNLDFYIRIEGELNENWTEYFGAQSMSVELDEAGFPLTALTSEPVDQAGLIGMINRLNSMALPVISVEHVTVDMSGDLLGDDEAIVRILVHRGVNA